MKKRHISSIALFAYAAWSYLYVPKSTTISFRIGQTFAEVAQASTYPVQALSAVPDEHRGWGATDVEEPSVILHFNDPQHGFTLPPTTFAAITYIDKKVVTVATKPMLKKVTFSVAAKKLASLQAQFQAGGWQLENDTHWFDLSPSGLEKLRRELRSSKSGNVQTASLRIPRKYGLLFRIYCADRCDSNIGLDRYLIDIGISRDLGDPNPIPESSEYFPDTHQAPLP